MPPALSDSGSPPTCSTKSNAPSQIALTPDGSTLLVGFDDSDLLLWNWQKNVVEQRLSGHSGAITAVAVAPDGAALFSADTNGRIMVWNRTDGNLVADFKLPAGATNALAVSPDGRILVAGGSSNGGDLLAPGKLTAWDIESGEPIGMLARQHRNAIESLAFMPDGRHVIAASGRTNYVEANSNDLILWDVATQQPDRSFETTAHDNRVLAFHPDGTSFVTGFNRPQHLPLRPGIGCPDRHIQWAC